ncbi:AraC family transcriptional regulator [Herbaspirillum rubrisubalbicans]|uniref:AraC family transcriptional regulator n=1 Tax=Herbaspirillum rubrisubalbicans TaxID=80842 RepID=A0AAD0UB89_9BURK|nr:helix-turn-helix transcriptional regulator [Herbaspirillum rubrisubalbicans]ALU91316.1 AraC family transcription regulator protein [Herbaspirillum rubrisubalbicans M1]AYR26340.1 AraC family transcriptional regulator [Herbaspirillum rubrisubalbicans]
MTTLYASLIEHDPDRLSAAVTALRVYTNHNERETPLHSHRKGQLVVALHGAVTCETTQGMWIVPPQSAVWIPPGVPHSNRVTPDGQLCFLFIAPHATSLPDHCCTLALTPLLVQMICHLAELPQDYAPHERTARLAAVLVEELESSQRHVLPLHLPMPQHWRLREIARHLSEHPADRSTVAEWGQRHAMSERSFARFVQAETGMSFGRWRRQIHLMLALQRLASGSSVQRVSQDLGYDSVSAFITMFKKTLGKPPARYMAQRQAPPAPTPAARSAAPYFQPLRPTSWKPN